MNKAISDYEMLEINESGDLKIIDENRNQRELIIAKIPPENMSGKIKNLIGKLFSVSEFNLLYDNKKLVLKEPEKFMQTIISKTVHKKLENNLGWIQEYKVPNNDNSKSGEYFSLDLAYVINNSKNDYVMGFIENKNYNHSNKNSFLSKKEEGISQTIKYIKAVNDYNFGSVEKIVSSLYLYDADYFFNNPNHLNNIEFYILNNTDFFKTINFTFDTKEIPYITEEKKLYEIGVLNNNSGILEFLKVEDFSNITRINEKYVLISPEEIISINRYSNPREEEIIKTTLLANRICEDIKYCLDKNMDYHPNKYTQEKQINVMGPLNFDKSSKIVYGHGLSLSNGQHSSSAYFFIKKLLNKETFLIDDDILFNKLKISINEIINSGKENNIYKNIILKAKITEANNKEEEIAMATASNFSVGNVDTKISTIIPFLIKLNNNLYSRNSKIQIKYPRIKIMNGYNYFDYDILLNLIQIKESKNCFSVFRKNGSSWIEGFKKHIFKQINNKMVRENNKEIKKLENEIEEMQDEKSEIRGSKNAFNLLKERMQEKEDKLSKIKESNFKLQNFDFEIDEEKHETVYNTVIDFERIYQIILEENNITVGKTKEVLISKLALGLYYNKRSRSSEFKKQEKELYMKNAVIISRFFNSDFFKDYDEDFSINKNAIFNNNKISSKILELSMNLMDDFKMEELKQKVKEIIKNN